MVKFTQKYTIVRLFEDFPDGYEYSMKDWPLHVTLADVFAINDNWEEVFEDLKQNLKDQTTFFTKVVASDLFGEDRSVKVKLIENTDKLQNLHEKIIGVLKMHGVVFNSPQYINKGFKPHSAEQSYNSMQIGDVVELGSITLIDMFPNGDPFRRRVLGTIRFL